MNALQKNTIQIVLASLTGYAEKSLPLVQAKKKTSILDAVNKYSFWKDQLRHELGIVLIEHLLLKAGVDTQDLHKLKRNSFGKPFLPTHPIGFNVSHSGDYVVAVCAESTQVGVDIEQNRSIDISAYESIFHTDEWAYLQSENTADAFFEVWTKKESLLKARGTGFQVDLARINIFDPKAAQQYFHPVLIKNHTCHVCSTSPVSSVEITEWAI
ncbi:MAG: 4'-phosphopantetheinyl transferase superfamily protein [Cytophagia bacterium]|nr:4'-phosphopantetheinyl transferase superfamily protein [Cytophagia bacterium]